MDRTSGPSGRLLVGAFFIYLCIVLGAASGQMPANLPYLQSSLKGPNSHDMPNLGGSNTGILKIDGSIVVFPWADRHNSGSRVRRADIMPRSLPSSEKINLDGSDSKTQISDLKAINSIKQREMVYDDTQYKDKNGKDLTNSLDVSITGKGEAKKEWPVDHFDEDNIEKIVDDALTRNTKNESKSEQQMPDAGPRIIGNNMNIEVSGVTVSAINTVEGGSAVATSNIIIKPVQIIVTPEEVDEKLK